MMYCYTDDDGDHCTCDGECSGVVIPRRAHVYKEWGSHGTWWMYDVYEAKGPLRARYIMSGTQPTWQRAFEAAWAWVTKDLRRAS